MLFQDIIIKLVNPPQEKKLVAETLLEESYIRLHSFYEFLILSVLDTFLCYLLLCFTHALFVEKVQVEVC